MPIISVKCFATLAEYQPADPELVTVPEGATAGDVIDQLAVPREEVQIIFVNSRHAKPETVLQEGDKVGLFPAVGGG